MQLFRDMSEPDSTDITQYPGYNKLSGDEQKKVAETYTNVYNNNQGKLGYRVAQGIAFETAKKMCESFVVEGASPAASARAKAWRATQKARNTQKPADHEAAGRLHIDAAKLHDGAKAKEHRGQAGVHFSLAASDRKYISPNDADYESVKEDSPADPAPGLIADEGDAMDEAQGGPATGKYTCSNCGFSKRGTPMSMQGKRCPKCNAYSWKRPQFRKEDENVEEKYMGFQKLKGELADKPGVRNPGAVAAYIGNKKYGKKAMHSGHKLGEDEGKESIVDNTISKLGPSYESVEEGDAEDFQDRNDALVGMTEAELAEFAVSQTGKRFVMKDGVKHRVIGVRDGQLVTEPVAHKNTSTSKTHRLVRHATYESEDGLVSAANPEEDGAARQLRLNHDKMCTGCGAIHPLDVVCYNGRTHSEAPNTGMGMTSGMGSGDILKQNHMTTGASLGMNVEETDPMISAAASYLTNRAKVSGLMESLQEDVLPSTGAGEIQKVNLAMKCPNCGAMRNDGKCACTSGDCSCNCAPGKCNCTSGVCKCDTGKCVGAGDILKKNHENKGASLGLGVKEDEIQEDELGEKYYGFNKLSAKVGSPALAAWIGRKKYGKEGFSTHKHKGEVAEETTVTESELQEALDVLWEENFYPAQPMEEHCGHCGHPKSYHDVDEGGGCATCQECEKFATEAEVDEGEKKKNQICFCGHEFGGHNKGGCKVCKHEGVVTGGRAAHQFKKNDYQERFEAEYAEIFAAQQGKINTTLANAAMNWLPEELELAEGKGYDDIGPGDHVKFNHPLRGSDKVPQQGKGKVVMKGPHGWVLNAGGKHGTPQVVGPDNYVEHRKAKKNILKGCIRYKGRRNPRSQLY